MPLSELRVLPCYIESAFASMHPGYLAKAKGPGSVRVQRKRAWAFQGRGSWAILHSMGFLDEPMLGEALPRAHSDVDP